MTNINVHRNFKTNMRSAMFIWICALCICDTSYGRSSVLSRQTPVVEPATIVKILSIADIDRNSSMNPTHQWELSFYNSSQRLILAFGFDVTTTTEAGDPVTTQTTVDLVQGEAYRTLNISSDEASKLPRFEPGRDYRVTLNANARNKTLAVKVTAVVFSDDTAIGNEEIIAKVFDARGRISADKKQFASAVHQLKTAGGVRPSDAAVTSAAMKGAGPIAVTPMSEAVNEELSRIKAAATSHGSTYLDSVISIKEAESQIYEQHKKRKY
jgi:hypothetical protein